MPSSLRQTRKEGRSVVGLWNGRVEGVDGSPAGRLAECQQAAMDFTAPAVPCRSRLLDCLDVDGRANHLLVFDVETSPQVHANRRDEVLLRAR